MNAQVILVDANDNEIGVADKREVHEQGLLHRAVSVFVFNSSNELLLQKRAPGKYHSGGLWTNTACSHPAPGETALAAARRRLTEEMGIRAEPIFLFKFIYKIRFDNGLTEHEIDHVFVAYSDALPIPDPAEVAAYRFINDLDLMQEIASQPENFTEWFKGCHEAVFSLIATS